MITNFIIQIFYYCALAISLTVSSFGDVTDTNAITTSIIALQSYYVSLNAYLPLDTILQIMAFDLAFEGFVFSYKLIRWAYNKIPSIN